MGADNNGEMGGRGDVVKRYELVAAVVAVLHTRVFVLSYSICVCVHASPASTVLWLWREE